MFFFVILLKNTHELRTSLSLSTGVLTSWFCRDFYPFSGVFFLGFQGTVWKCPMIFDLLSLTQMGPSQGEEALSKRLLEQIQKWGFVLVGFLAT